jgi:MYXO-CTERM domain-containing protein
VFGIGAFAVAFLSLQPQSLAVEPNKPLPIVGGNETTLCQFPSAVAILEGDETPVMCTGTLVHPNVVTFAAHCVNPERPVVGVGFGEEGQGDTGPARTVAVQDCVAHPQYENLGYPDIAYCTLPDAVTDVPIVPILAGCELDLLVPDAEVTIVGFGATFGTYVDGELEAEGVGPKRYTTQTIDLVEPELDEVHMVGPDGSQSACFGDSGGPAMIELPDGTWRVFGAASRLYDPGGFPPPALPDNFCGVGVTYGLLTTQLEWLETETGFDLTPCHDETGSWAPSDGCGPFPTAPQTGVSDWANGCGGGAVGGGDPVCEDPVGTSTGGDDTTGEPPDETSTGDESTGSSTGFGVGTGGSSGDIPEPPPSGTTSGSVPGSTGTPGTSGSSSGGVTEEDGATDRGCSCRGGEGPGPAAVLWGVVLLGLRRRR